ncbi:MAG: excinuclease ABC subunit UvrC [Spirochaetaceae bacterium]|nr:excinuclease ABC subunit UvrC [Spirochaetaceae bacterium]
MDQNKAPRKPRAAGNAEEKPPNPAEARLLRLRSLVKQAPGEPGVYIMRDADARIIYVGKAKVLKNRLGSYFTGRKDLKTRHLVSRIETIEWIIAPSEYEALLIENNLIKEHGPKYNINLKDGKTYPSVRVTNEPFPRVFRTRRIVNDGSSYFGPFPSAETIDVYLDLVRRLFPLRRCVVLKKRDAPCMYYHIGRCSAPCAGKISAEDYALHVEEVKKLLAGDTEALLAELKERMAEASLALRFEEAARLRDAVQAIELFAGRASAVDFDPAARDYVAWAADGDLVVFATFQMRGGKLTGRDVYRSRLYGTEEEALESFLMGYYEEGRPPPPRVFLPAPPEGIGVVAEYFRKELGLEVAFLPPDGAGPEEERRHAAALAMARENAREELAKRRRELGDLAGIEELRRALGLQSLPERIEGFDIAHLHGKHTVASLVSFKNGIPDKKNYRYFKIKSLEGEVDDFASIREAVARRYTRLVNEGADLPDLILVDGGAGQVSAAREILEALGVDSELAGLAKQNEEIYRPGAEAPIVLPKDSPALRVLVAVRDETHRFATGLNQRLRASELKFGILEGIDGVGKARAERLMRVFGSLGAMAGAGAEAVAKAGGLGKAEAARVLEAVRAALRDKGEELGEVPLPSAAPTPVRAEAPAKAAERAPGYAGAARPKTGDKGDKEGT